MTLNERAALLRERWQALRSSQSDFQSRGARAIPSQTGRPVTAVRESARSASGGPQQSTASGNGLPGTTHPRRKKTDRTQSARALRYQARNLAKGLCRMCPNPRVTKYYCARHAAHLSDWERRKKGKTGPARVYRCGACLNPGHTRVSCERRKAVAARSQEAAT